MMQECKATASISHTALLPFLLWDFPNDVHQLHRVLCVRLCGQMTTKVRVKTASHFFPSEPSQNLNSGLQRGKLAKPSTVIISASFTAGRSSGKREKKKNLEERTGLQHSPQSKPAWPWNSNLVPLRDTCLFVYIPWFPTFTQKQRKGQKTLKAIVHSCHISHPFRSKVSEILRESNFSGEF